MPIKTITLTNIAGFETFTASLPAIALIQARNKRGKSALLSCITYPHDRGHDPDMFTPITAGAEYGEIIQEMDDGTMVRALVGKNNTDRFTKSKDGKRWNKGRAEIDAMSQAITYAPMRLMDLTEKELLDEVLRIMPLETQPGEIETALGELATPELLAITASNALELIGDERSGIYGEVYKTRRTVSSEADGLAKHADQLLKALPPAAPEGTNWEAEADRLEREIKALESKNRANLTAIKDLFSKYKVEQISAWDTKIADADATRRAAILAANEAYDVAENQATDSRDTSIEAARAEASGEHEKQREAFTAQSTPLTTDLATARERARAMISARTTQENAATAKAEATAKQDRSKLMTAALTRLITLKNTVAARLKIPGIAFQEGRMGRMERGNFVPFIKWNTADKMSFCFKIGLIANKAGFMVIDDAEHFDPFTRQALMEACVKFAESKKMQFIVASATTDNAIEVLDGQAVLA